MADEAEGTHTHEATTSREELSQFLQFLREQAEEGITSTKEFVGEQAPLVVQELIAYKRAQETAGMLIPVMLWCCTATLWRWAKRSKDSDAAEGMGMLGLILGVVGFAIAILQTSDFLKAWFAPRLVVIDYLKDLL